MVVYSPKAFSQGFAVPGTIKQVYQGVITLLGKVNWGAFFRVAWWLICATIFLIAVPGMRPDTQSTTFQALGQAREYLFNFVEWEAGALADKGLNATLQPQKYLEEEARSQFVRDYLVLVGEIRELDSQVEAIYVDPAVDNPEVASADLREQRDALRAEQQEKQALAEAIIQAQVSELLVDNGFGVTGQVLPPVTIRFAQLPTMLIVSPRDRIERIGAYTLEYGLTVDQREAIEAGVDSEMGVSSLVVPIGGLGFWPAMLYETSNLPYVFEVAAHEWTHHYLTFYPLGFNYGVTPELYTMNETVASIVGTEIGWAVLDRYYPDLAPEPPDYTPQETSSTEPATPESPPVFDYRTEMRETRIRVDELLAEGKIGEAESYMEARRQVFVANGYQIRKINQAYFAFYGAYADQPGATGSDPIGPALRELRYYSESLHEYVTLVRGLTRFEEVQAILEERRTGGGQGG